MDEDTVRLLARVLAPSHDATEDAVRTLRDEARVVMGAAVSDADWTDAAEDGSELRGDGSVLERVFDLAQEWEAAAQSLGLSPTTLTDLVTTAAAGTVAQRFNVIDWLRRAGRPETERDLARLVTSVSLLDEEPYKSHGVYQGWDAAAGEWCYHLHLPALVHQDDGKGATARWGEGWIAASQAGPRLEALLTAGPRGGTPPAAPLPRVAVGPAGGGGSAVPGAPVIRRDSGTRTLWIRTSTGSQERTHYAFALDRPEPNSPAWTSQEAAERRAKAHQEVLNKGIRAITQMAEGNPGITAAELTPENITKELEREIRRLQR
ncbi:hypothetical protein OHV05_35520 (plasmid) [Kitasatospora sp. NBC_00070]|uniref:hypothetical protein n=1 Tax=Kitasatospora sp. NBC_00070 TaxID=2975962 RepID=UPI002F919B08